MNQPTIDKPIKPIRVHFGMENDANYALALENYVKHLESTLSQEKAKAFDEAEMDFIGSAINAYWYDANTKLQRKDLGDIERDQYQQQLNKSKELLKKFGF